MDSLPVELVQQILSRVSKRSLKNFRFVSRRFSTLSFHLLFAHIPTWLDYEKSHQAVTSLTHDVFNRPAVMWSPWASEPKGPVDDLWMGIVWRFLIKTDPPNGLTGASFAEMSGRAELSDNLLRTGQNRFLLFRKCVEDWDNGHLEGGTF